MKTSILILMGLACAAPVFTQEDDLPAVKSTEAAGAAALLGAGADPNLACGDATPLGLARAIENGELVALLKSKGAR